MDTRVSIGSVRGLEPPDEKTVEKQITKHLAREKRFGDAS
jgi:hypothetical protein